MTATRTSNKTRPKTPPPRGTTPSPQPRRMSLPLIAAAVLVLAAAAGAAAFAFMPGGGTPQGGGAQGPVSVKYIIETGQEGTEGTVDSPLRLRVSILGANGQPEPMIVGANVQLLDQAGKPAQYAGQAFGPVELTPSNEAGVLEYSGSVPSKEGSYHPLVQWQALSSDPQAAEAVTQTLELSRTLFTARPDSGPPVTSGYVFSDRSNLWIMSTDGKKQKRLTYLPSYSQYAITPDWSPDGSRIAYVYLPKVAPSEFPLTDIWTIKPDGTDAKPLITHGKDEALLHPSWSGDGKQVYFTVESGAYDPNRQMPVGLDRHVDTVEISSGTRSQWVPAAQMASADSKGGEVVYLEFARDKQADATGALPQRLVVTDPDGSDRKVLVEAYTFQAMSAPHISPDGKWVAFAAINRDPPRKAGFRPLFDLARWLLFEPDVAYAHGTVFWDIYLVPVSGGTPIRLTQLEEDEPYPVWLDNSTVAAMGVKGLFKIPVDAEGKSAGGPTRIRIGAPHGGLTWHGP